jgi:myo-inositol-1(or 4)-monophosphatase
MPLHLLQIAKKLGHDAGKMALKYQKHGFKTETKGRSNNLVTDADKACNDLIIKTISTNFPDHTIISEESEIMHGDSDYKWIIDPIDGTSNFAHGIPLFAISIAVVYKGKPIIGVVEIPALKESFSAKSGEGAYLGTNRIHVSKKNKMEECLFATGFPYERGSERSDMAMKLYKSFHGPSHGVRRFGSAALDLCYVAAGRFEGFFEYGLEVWDIAAGKVILEEAGGMVTNMDGSKLNPKDKNLLASNGLMHQQMMEIIKKEGGLKV